MHVLRRLRRQQAAQCLPELRRRFCTAADPTSAGMAAGTNGCETAAVRQARSSVLQPRRHRSAFGADQERSTAGSLTRRRDRALDLTEPDAIAVALAPAAHHKRIAVFEERALDAAGQLERLGAVPADLQQAAALILLRAGDGAAP